MWTNELINLWYMVPLQKHSLSNRSTYAVNHSKTFQVYIKRTGVIQVLASYYPASVGSTVHIYVSNTYDIDPTTGAPTSYIAHNTNGLQFNATLNNTYYITILSNNSSSVTIDTGLGYSLNSVKYLSKNKPAIIVERGMYGYEIGNVEGYMTYIFPVTIKTTGWSTIQWPIASGDTSYPDNAAVTTSLESINTTTGMPPNNIATNVSYSGTGCYGWNTTANTTYYVYIVVGISQYLRTKFYINSMLNQGYTNPVMCTINGIGTNKMEPDYQNANSWSYLGGNGKIAWSMDDTVPTGYKWMKFDGWYNDANFTQFLCKYPFYENVEMKQDETRYGTPNRLIYPKYILMTDDFEFTHTPTANAIFNLTADEYNDFVCYCAFKGMRVSGLNPPLENMIVKEGEQLPASKFNTLRNWIRCTTVPSVSAGDKIYAHYFIDLLNHAKGIN